MADHSKQRFVRWYLDLGRSLGTGIINMFFNEHAHTLCFLRCYCLVSSKTGLSVLAVVTDQAFGYSWLFLLYENSLLLQQS